MIFQFMIEHEGNLKALCPIRIPKLQNATYFLVKVTGNIQNK